MQIAPSVPLGIAVVGLRRLLARFAPERMPVKHGKKRARHCEKPIVSVNAGPQLARIVSTDSPVTEIGPTLPCDPSEPSEPALVDPAPTHTSPDPAPPEPAATPTVSGGADDFADLFRHATDAGAPRDFFDSRREDVSEAPAAFVAPLVPTNPPPDDFADLFFRPVQDTKPLELGAFEASPAPEATPPVAEDAEVDFGDFEASPMPSVVGDGGGDGLGGFGDFAAPPPAVPPAVPAVDALAELFGDARVGGSPPPAADEDEFGAFQ